MSLDIWLQKPECPTCFHADASESFNYTYNVSKMWYHIYPEDKHMVGIDGMTGAESFDKLLHARHRLTTETELFDKMNPQNGWGSREGFVAFLNRLIEEASSEPTLIWDSCR